MESRLDIEGSQDWTTLGLELTRRTEPSQAIDQIDTALLRHRLTAVHTIFTPTGNQLSKEGSQNYGRRVPTRKGSHQLLHTDLHNAAGSQEALHP